MQKEEPIRWDGHRLIFEFNEMGWNTTNTKAGQTVTVP